jgi:hypothetical protein
LLPLGTYTHHPVYKLILFDFEVFNHKGSIGFEVFLKDIDTPQLCFSLEVSVQISECNVRELTSNILK